MRNPRKSPNLRVHGLLDSCFALTRRKKMTGELDLKDHLFSSWCITQNLSIASVGQR